MAGYVLLSPMIISMVSLVVSGVALTLAERDRKLTRALRAQELADSAARIIAEERKREALDLPIDDNRAFQAEQSAREAVSLEPRNHKHACILADALCLRGKDDAALQLLGRLARRRRSAHAVRCRLAVFYFRTDKLLEAEAAAESAVRSDPKCSNAFQTLAQIRLRQGRDPQALEAMTTAIENAPHDASIIAQLGAMLANLKLYQDASVMLRTAIGRGERNVRTYANLARVLTEMGQNAEALRISEIAVSLNPANVRALTTAATLLEKNGQVDVAEKRLREALALNPADLDAMCALADMLRRQNRRSEAAEIITLLKEHPAPEGDDWPLLTELRMIDS